MRRLRASLGCDILLQARHGFYLVSALLAPVLGWLLGLLPIDRAGLDAILPAVMAFNLLITTFFFVGALVLYERSQGSLLALATSPIRATEYLASKVMSLTLLGLAESLAVVVIAFGFAVVGPGLVLGGFALGTLYVLFGFVTIARFDSFNAYLLPAVGVTLALFLPIVHVTGAWTFPAWHLHPTFPPLLLLQEPAAPALWGYGAVASAAWIALAFAWARRVYVRATTIQADAASGAAA